MIGQSPIGPKHITTDAFGKMLRDYFRVRDQVTLELEETVIPVYNLAPADVIYKVIDHAVGAATACATVPVPSMRTVEWDLTTVRAANTQVNFFTGIPAGKAFKVDINLYGTAPLTVGDYIRFGLFNTVPNILNDVFLIQCMAYATQIQFVNSFTTGWLNYLASDLTFAAVTKNTAGGSGMFAVARLYQLP